VEVHDALEAPVANLRELDRADADPVASARAKARCRSVPVATPVSQGYRPASQLFAYAAAALSLRFRVSRSGVVCGRRVRSAARFRRRAVHLRSYRRTGAVGGGRRPPLFSPAAPATKRT